MLSSAVRSPAALGTQDRSPTKSYHHDLPWSKLMCGMYRQQPDTRTGAPFQCSIDCLVRCSQLACRVTYGARRNRSTSPMFPHSTWHSHVHILFHCSMEEHSYVVDSKNSSTRLWPSHCSRDQQARHLQRRKVSHGSHVPGRRTACT